MNISTDGLKDGIVCAPEFPWNTHLRVATVTRLEKVPRGIGIFWRPFLAPTHNYSKKSNVRVYRFKDRTQIRNRVHIACILFYKQYILRRRRRRMLYADGRKTQRELDYVMCV